MTASLETLLNARPRPRELDTRPIEGTPDSIVRLLVWDDASFLVEVDHEGVPVAELDFASYAEAREAFEHPFARPDVPDLFQRETPND